MHLVGYLYNIDLRCTEILRRHCSLNRVVKENVKERTEVAGRRGIKHKQLLNDLKETGGHWNFKEEPLARTLWATRCGTGYGLVVRQTTEFW